MGWRKAATLRFSSPAVGRHNSRSHKRHDTAHGVYDTVPHQPHWTPRPPASATASLGDAIFDGGRGASSQQS